jgi:hypothetical protein
VGGVALIDTLLMLVGNFILHPNEKKWDGMKSEL